MTCRFYRLSLQEHVSFTGMFDRDQAGLQLKSICSPSSVLAYLPRLPLCEASSKEVFPCLLGHGLCIPFQNWQQFPIFSSTLGRTDFSSRFPDKFFRSIKCSLPLKQFLTKCRKESVKLMWARAAKTYRKTPHLGINQKFWMCFLFKYLNIVSAFPSSSEWLFQTLKKSLWIPFLDQTWWGSSVCTSCSTVWSKGHLNTADRQGLQLFFFSIGFSRLFSCLSCLFFWYFIILF